MAVICKNAMIMVYSLPQHHNFGESMPTSKRSRERINCLLRLMKENRYPNYRMLLKEMRRMDIAGAYEVSRRTVQRDISWLKTEYNAPIQYDPSRKGYYLTSPYWEKYVPFLEENEMDAAIIGARIAQTVLPESQIQKDIQQGTDALWSRNNGSSDEFMTLASLVINGTRAKIPPQIFQTVFSAWREHHPLKITYRRITDGRISEYQIEPHVLTLHDAVWYLRGKTEKGHVLNFVLQRILSAETQTGCFQPDQKLVDSANAGHILDIPRYKKVKIKLSGAAARYGLEYLPFREKQTTPDGNVILDLHDVEEHQVINCILLNSGDAVVLEPADLQQKILDCAKKLLKEQKKIMRQ